MLAMLLDLIERGYYDTKATSTDKEDLDMSITKAAKRPEAKLEPHEQEVLDFFMS